MRRIGVAERRARLGLRHRLAAAARADDPLEVARGLVALHATDPTSVYLAAWARMGTDEDAGAVERALYDRRVLIRMLGMRRTVFVAPLDAVPVIHAACTRAIAGRERRKLITWLAESGVADDAGAWLQEVEEVALRALAARGEATAAELAADDPRLREQIVLARGKSYEGRVSVGSRVLFLLAADGRVVRGRPGSWTSSQYRWSPMETWCQDGTADWPTEAAETELARRWLAAFGPGTAEDLRWWAGWSAGQVKRVLARLRPAEVDLGGATGLVLPGDLEPVAAPEPWAALLPPLDPTPMGWSQREWFLGAHGPKLFDRTGNVGPTAWWNGRIVGGWAHRPVKGDGEAGGEIAVRLVEDVGADAVAALETAAQRLAARLGPARVTARGRGPTLVEQELNS